MGTSLGIGGLVAAGGAFLQTNAGKDLLDTVLIRSARGFYTGDGNTTSDISVLPDVVVRESHTDTLQLTTHPVEQGANINDHLYRQPSQVTILMGFASTLVGLVNSDIRTGLPSPSTRTSLPLDIAKDLVKGKLGDAYADLITIFKNQELSPTKFTVVTGKRLYKDMVLLRLVVTTDSNTENSLLVECVFQELIIVTTSNTHVDALPKTPAKTAPTTEEGTNQPQDPPESILHKLGGFSGIGKALGSVFK